MHSPVLESVRIRIVRTIKNARSALERLLFLGGREKRPRFPACLAPTSYPRDKVRKRKEDFIHTGCRAAAATAAAAAAAFIPALGYISVSVNPKYLFPLLYHHTSLPRLVKNETLTVVHHSRGMRVNGEQDRKRERERKQAEKRGDGQFTRALMSRLTRGTRKSQRSTRNSRYYTWSIRQSRMSTALPARARYGGPRVQDATGRFDGNTTHTV